MSRFQSYASLIDRLNEKLANTVRWLALAMVLITLTIVVLRYAFNMGAIVLQESVMYLHALLFMLAIPYGLKKDSHVRVDLVYSRLNEQHKSWVNLAGHVLFLLPLCVFIFVTSLPYVQASWRVLEGSSEVGGIPAVFLLKTLIPTMAVLLFLQGCSEIIKALQHARR